MTHICVGNLTITGSDNGLSPGRRQAITWTNVGILLIRPLGTNFSEMLIEIPTFSFKKIHLKMSSGKWRPFCLGLNVLRTCHHYLRCSTSHIACTWALLLWCFFCGLNISPRGLFQYQVIFPGKRIPIIKIRHWWGCLIYIMGIPIRLRWHLYI